jgi:hypothetical protein
MVAIIGGTGPHDATVTALAQMASTAVASLPITRGRIVSSKAVAMAFLP